MGKFELNYEKDKEILQRIKDIILNRFPVLDDRLDILFTNPRPSMKIFMNFSEYDNKEFTQISFSFGTELFKKSVPESLKVDGLISNDVLISIISFILDDHDVIKSINKFEKNIFLSFEVDLRNDNMKGMGCGEIELELDFKFCPNPEEALNSYLKTIVNSFYEKLKHTETFKREYNKYCLLAKEKIINSLTQDELYSLVSLLDNKDLCEMLLNLSNERFIEIYNEFENQKARKK